MKTILTLILAVGIGFIALGQNDNAYDYSDLVVLINANDTTSQAIGNYFKKARGIPDQNIIPTTTAPNKEHIDSATFETLLNEITDSLNARNLDTGINYLVTTKGMPLGVSRDTTDFFAGVPYSPFNASLESELAVLNSPAENFIGDSLAISNPFAGVNQHHDKSTHGIYLVSRLDGYHLEDIKNMIDRSGPNTIVDLDSSKFVFDQDPSKDNHQSKNFLNQRMDVAHQFLKARGWQSVNNTDTVYLTNQKDVLGYTSWGSNDAFQSHFTQNGTPNHDWKQGSFAAFNVSTSARSFDSSTSYGQSLIADLIANGNTGAAGYVYEPFAAAIVHMDTFLARYTSNVPSEPYTLGEAYYMASPFLSWMDVLVGDPKTSIMTCNEVTLSAGTDTFTCQNNALELEAKSNIKGASFYWEGMTSNFSDSGSKISLTPDTTQSYLLTLKKDECIKKDTVKINVLPEPFKAGNDTTLCFDDQLQLDPKVHDTSVSYYWQPESLFDDPYQMNPVISPDTSARITLEVIQNNCLLKDSFNVTIETAPVSTPDHITICSGDSATLKAKVDTFKDGQYQWAPDQAIDNASIPSPTIYPDSNITYHLLLANDYCATRDSTSIKVRQPVKAEFDFNINNRSVTFFDSSKSSDSTLWQLGDGHTSRGAYPHNFNHSYAEEDTFLVCQKVWNSCFIDTTCQTIITATSSLSESKNNKVLNIYPNPTHHQLIIESPNQPLPESLHLINNKGKTMMKRKSGSSSHSLKMNLGDLPDGVYYLRSGGLNQSYQVIIR